MKKNIKKSSKKIIEIREDFFEKEKKEPNFLEPEILSKFLSDRGKILPRSRTGLSAKNQRKLTRAVKHARHLALLPFIVKAE